MAWTKCASAGLLSLAVASDWSPHLTQLKISEACAARASGSR